MIRILTDCRPCSNVRWAANYAIAGSLGLTAICWDYGVPQMIYDHVHLRFAPAPAIQILPRRDPPEWLSFVSSDHALLIEKVADI